MGDKKGTNMTGVPLDIDQTMRGLIPDQVSHVISQLESAGYEAYAVGGCVRDALLGREPHDWDLTTSATPDQMRAAVHSRSIETGIQHGTITFMVGGMPIETTVFRTEGTYSDGRHPDSVAFASTLEEDLARRDFTINAMAWSPTSGMQDPFGGTDDLASSVLRCVGNPRERFSEDGLRVMRALRFAAVYNLEIEPDTAEAVHEKKDMLSAVSAERISTELTKMMSAPDGRHLADVVSAFSDVFARIMPEVEPMIGYDQLNPYHDRDLWIHSLDTMATVPADPMLRMAALLHDVGKPACRTIGEDGVAHYYGHMEEGRKVAESAMTRLKFSRKEVEEVSFLVSQHDNRPSATMKSARRFLARCGNEETARKLLALMGSDGAAHAPAAVAKLSGRLDAFGPFMDRALSENTAFKVSDLEIGGRDLMEMGWEPGPAMGAELKRLFDAVMSGDVPNERAALLSAVAGDGDLPSAHGADESQGGVEVASGVTASQLASPMPAAENGKIWVEPHVRAGYKVRGYWRAP